MMIIPLLLAAALETPTAALSAPSPATPFPHHVFVETDPSTFVFSGFSGHLRWRPAGALTAHWSLGIGVYAMNLPSIYTKLAADNRGAGWSLRARLGTAVFVDRFLRDTADGFFIGVEAGTQTLEVSRAGGAARFTTLLFLPRVGYLYRPFDNGFYVMPWVGAGVTTKIGGRTDVGDVAYAVFPGIAFATLHVGWRI